MLDRDGQVFIVPVDQESRLLEQKIEEIKEKQPQNREIIELFEGIITDLHCKYCRMLESVTGLMEQKISDLENIEALLQKHVDSNSETQEEIRKYLKAWS